MTKTIKGIIETLNEYYTTLKFLHQSNKAPALCINVEAVGIDESIIIDEYPINTLKVLRTLQDLFVSELAYKIMNTVFDGRRANIVCNGDNIKIDILIMKY